MAVNSYANRRAVSPEVTPNVCVVVLSLVMLRFHYYLGIYSFSTEHAVTLTGQYLV